MLAKLKNIINNSGIKETLLHAKNYFVSHLATQAISLISLPIFTRILLPADYGLINIFSTWVLIFSIVLPLNLYTAINRYYYENKDDFDSFLGTSILISYICLAVSLCLLLIFKSQLAHLMGIPEPVIYFIIPAVTMAVLDGIFMQVFLPRRSSKLIRNFSIAQTIVGFLISVSFVYWMFENKLSNRYLGRLWADVALFVVFGGLKIYQISKYVKLRIDRKHIKYIANYSIPIIPYLLSGQILSLADRLFIEKYHGMTQSGLYSFAYNISMLQIPISNALYNAFVPDYFKYYNEERYKEHDVAVTQLYKIISLSAVFLILFGYEIGKILGSQSYSASLFIIPIVIIGHWLNAIFPIYSRNFQFKKRTFVAAWVTLSAAIVNIILNILFIPKYGNIAAAYNTTISFLFLSLTGYFVSKYVVKIHTLNPIHLLKPFLVMIITAVVFYTYFIPHAQYFILNILLKLIFVLFTVDILYLNYINKFIYRIIKSN